MRLALGIALIAGGAVIAGAQVTNSIDETTIANFGTLNQNAVGGAMYCAPTATMNSFMWLQAAYPTVYGVDGLGNPVLQGGAGTWLAAAQLLAGPNYMNTSPINGTTEGNWANGKANYLNFYAPGKTVFAGMDSDLTLNRPAWDLNANPTIVFILNELRLGEDVELGIDPSSGIGHVLTLTGAMWVDMNNGVFTIGDPLFFNTIDPANPIGNTLITIDPASENNPAGGNPMGIIGVNYNGYRLTGALAESPIPEPATITLAFLGGVSLMLRRRRV
jgi:hypothetical protein